MNADDINAKNKKSDAKNTQNIDSYNSNIEKIVHELKLIGNNSSVLAKDNRIDEKQTDKDVSTCSQTETHVI